VGQTGEDRHLVTYTTNLLWAGRRSLPGPLRGQSANLQRALRRDRHRDHTGRIEGYMAEQPAPRAMPRRPAAGPESLAVKVGGSSICRLAATSSAHELVPSN